MIFTIPCDPYNDRPGITDRLGRQLHDIGFLFMSMSLHVEVKSQPSIVVRLHNRGKDAEGNLKHWKFLNPASPDPRVRDHHGVELVNALRASSMKRTDNSVEFVIPLRPDDEVFLSSPYVSS